MRQAINWSAHLLLQIPGVCGDATRELLYLVKDRQTNFNGSVHIVSCPRMLSRTIARELCTRAIVATVHAFYYAHNLVFAVHTVFYME